MGMETDKSLAKIDLLAANKNTVARRIIAAVDSVLIFPLREACRTAKMTPIIINKFAIFRPDKYLSTSSL